MRLSKFSAIRLSTTMAVLLSASLFFTSCKKDHDDAPATTSVEGVYSGKQGFGAGVPEVNFKINVKVGGEFLELGVNSGTPVCPGTWELDGNTLTATYSTVSTPYSSYSLKAVYNPATQKLSGTWGYDESDTDGGSILLSK